MRFNRASSKPKISLRMHLKRIRVHKKCIQYKLNIIIIIIEEGGFVDVGKRLRDRFKRNIFHLFSEHV
jgi:hypothetical protein